MPAAVLSVRDLRREHRHAGRVLLVLDGLSFDVHAGEMLVITGRSGSGKSTLLHILGLIDDASSGTVLHRGRDLRGATDDDRARERLTGIGFVFQHFHLVETLTARQNIALPLKARGASAAEVNARVDALLARTGLTARADHLPRELSGGQQQLVAVARALANRPYVVLADEPTGELDGESAQAVMRLLEEAAREGAAVVLVTHSPDLAPAGARRLALGGIAA